MTLREQKQRILRGKMYNDLAPELVEARRAAVELTSEYNVSYGQVPEIREPILEKPLRNVGEHVSFEFGFRCEFEFDIPVGKNLYANSNCILLDPGSIEIGDHVLFGPHISTYTARHAYNATERAAGACLAKPAKIGNHAWVGGGVHMDHGITTGDNTIIGADSVVTRDTPANVVTADIPCKVIHPVTEDEKTDYFDILKKYQEDGHENTIYIKSRRNSAGQQKGSDELRDRDHQLVY